MWEAVACLVAAQVNASAAVSVSSPATKPDAPKPSRTHQEPRQHHSPSPAYPFPPTSAENVLLNLAINL